MPTRKCSILNCTSVERNEKFSHFKFPPVDSEDFQAWCIAACSSLVVKRKVNFKNYYICELHFTNECFDQTGIVMWKDGQKVEIPRKVKRLKKGAVPSIFPDIKPTPLFLINITNTRNVSECARPACSTSLGIELPLNTNIHDENVAESKLFSYAAPLKVALNSKLPYNWTMVNTTEGTLYNYDSDHTATRSCLIRNDLTVEIKVMNQVSKYPPIKKAASLSEVHNILEKVAKARLCANIYEGQSCPNVLFLPPSRTNSLCIRCPPCQTQRTNTKNLERRKQCRRQARLLRAKNIRQKHNQTLKRRKSVHQQLSEAMRSLSKIKFEKLEEIINCLDEPMKLSIRAAHKLARLKFAKGARYTPAWILQCLLIRIKSRKTYLQLRNEKLLPLPSIALLNRYLANLKPSHCPDQALFNLLRSFHIRYNQ